MSIKFGFCLPLFAYPGSRFIRTPAYQALDPALTFSSGLRAEELGYDSLWIADHLMLGKDQAILEGWTTLCALAGATKRVRLGMIHQANLFRHPALAAKMIATVDQISNGRFIYFADPGSAAHEHKAYGLPWSDDQKERIMRLEEGLDIILNLWRETTSFSYSGSHYSVHNALCNPKPLQTPHPPIWFGSTNGDMHTLCAKYGQGWNTTPISLEGLKIRLHDLDTTFQKHNRSIADIEKSLEVQILIGQDLDAIRQKILHIISLDSELIPIDDSLQAFLSAQTDEIPSNIKSTWLIGTPEMIENQMNAFIKLGIAHFMLWFVDWPNEDGLTLFAEQVARKYK